MNLYEGLNASMIDGNEICLNLTTFPILSLNNIYIYIYIYILSFTDGFVLSELFSVARHVGRSKPRSKPIQHNVRLSLRPLGQQVCKGNF